MELNIKIADWTIPYCGNVHSIPYGTLIVSDGNRKERCKTKGDKWDDIGPQYIVFNHRQYKVINQGTLDYPKIELEPIRHYNPWQNKYQRNGYTIKWNESRDKWAVSEKRNGRTIVLEEFGKWNDAEDWCYEN